MVKNRKAEGPVLTLEDFVAYKGVIEGILEATEESSDSKAMLETICRMSFEQWVKFQNGDSRWN